MMDNLRPINTAPRDGTRILGTRKRGRDWPRGSGWWYSPAPQHGGYREYGAHPAVTDGELVR